MDTPQKPILQENVSRNRYLRALALYAITLLIGFALFKLANTHIISGWLYYANLLAFGWVNTSPLPCAERLINPSPGAGPGWTRIWKIKGVATRWHKIVPGIASYIPTTINGYDWAGKCTPSSLYQTYDCP